MFQKATLVLAYVTIATAMYTVTVKTTQGTVTGVRKATTFNGRMYCAFYGIPYARPPLGGLRFKNPLEPLPWKASRDCTSEFHSACAQSHVMHRQNLFGMEDCLYLNIYTPNLPKVPEDIVPVLVWYHGHDWSTSFSHIFGPDMMIENGVVMVSVTYRIGAFGFLKVNASDEHANMGLKDILRSLIWINKNIAKFGGDKTKITVMGNNSAATLLALLSLTRKGRKYFSKMVLHSGGIFSTAMYDTKSTDEAFSFKQKLEINMGKPLTEAKIIDIVLAAQRMISNEEVLNKQRHLVPFGPTRESNWSTAIIKHTPDDYYKIKKNLFVKIPVMIGSNTQEGLGEAMNLVHNPSILRSLNSSFKFMVPFSNGCSLDYNSKAYGEISGRIKQFYFNGSLDENSLDKFLKYLNDLVRYPIYRFIDALIPNGIPLYVYKFSYSGILNAYKANILQNSKKPIKGAASGDELCYIFNCEPYWETYRKLHNESENIHRKFMVFVAGMWANFVKFGDPTPTDQVGNLTWLPITPTQKQILFIGRKSEMIKPQVEDKMYLFWNQIYNDYYADNRCAKDEL